MTHEGQNNLDKTYIRKYTAAKNITLQLLAWPNHPTLHFRYNSPHGLSQGYPPTEQRRES